MILESIGKTAKRRNHLFGLWLFALAFIGFPGAQAHAAIPIPFVMGTTLDETTLLGKWYRLVYGEAFRRLGIPLEVVVVPTARLTSAVDHGDINGQCGRVFAYAASRPDEVRVEEVLYEVRLILYAFGPAPHAEQLQRLEDLTAGKWLVEYRRGVAVCEQKLKSVLPAERLSDVTNIEQGLKKLKAGRTDYFCEFDLTVNGELLTPAFREETGFRQALDLNVAGLALYPYLHKNHAELAPRLAETLKQIKAEGLVERYLRVAERELKAAP